MLHGLIGLLLLLPCLLAAQSTGATLSGTVQDALGASIPGATVTVTHRQTGARSTSLSNSAGFYSIRPLPIGTYLLEVEKAGFRREKLDGLELSTGQAAEWNATLEVGSTTESVNVSARSSLLETRSSEGSQLIESKTIEDIPLGDRRAMNLIEITGAAVFVNYESGAKPNFSLAGGRTQSQMFLIDGGSGQNMRLGVGQIDTDPPVESLQEVKVLSNGYSAEFGGSAGGVIIANTKSGTNKIRGSLFEYLRNQVLDAPNFFSPIVNGAKQRPALRYNVFGGTIGGPIRKNKTFYFGSYEGSRRRDGSVRTLSVPTPLERQGNFNSTFNARGPVLVYDPFASSRDPVTNAVVRSAFPGNRIPESRWDPIGRNLLRFFPLPNRPADDVTGANNFRANDINALTRDNIILKLDHHFNDLNTVTVRYMYNSDNNIRNSIFPTPDADPTNQGRNHQTFWYGTWTRILSPTRINELRLTYGRRQALSFSRGFGNNWPSNIGFKGVSDDAFPRIEVAGYAALGSTQQERRQVPIEQYHLSEGFSWNLGTHTFKFGGEIRPSLNYEIFRPYASGRYTFDRGFTAAINNQAFSGNGIATMLLGIPGTVEVRETDVLDRRSFYYSAYLQDDWTVRPGLTLNLGVRWEFDSPMKDANGRFNGFDSTAINPVSGTPGVVKFGGINGYRDTLWDPDYNNFGPRVGFAWHPKTLKSTVIRGGYGIFFAHPFDRGVPNAASLGFERALNLVTLANIETIPYTVSNGLPQLDPRTPVLDDRYGAVRPGQNATNAITFFETKRRTGYSQQFSFRIQQELFGGTLFEAAYIANLSKKLPSANLPINQIRPERLGPGVGQAQRPFPQFTNVSIIAPNVGVSNYHALALRTEKRFSKGFNLLGTYTYAKFLDNSDAGAAGLGDEGAAYSNFYNRRADYGPSENDIRHRLAWSSVYQLPFGKGKSFLSKGLASYLAGGWSIGAVMLLQSGPPITVATQQNTSFANSAGAQRADILRDPNLPASQRSLFRWFDTSAFSQPVNYTFGNQGVGLIRAPGVINLNTSLIRSFRFADRYQLQFRGEAFNIANRPNFATPGRVFEGPGFGIISAARPARQIQLGLRLTY